MSIWRNIKNVASVATDLIAISSMEVAHHLTKASDSTESATGKLAEKTAMLRAKHQADLAARKASIKKPVVVNSTPTDITTIN